MTIDALNVYDAHKQYQMEDGVFSETAILDGITNIEGIFDEHYDRGSKDSGNVTQQFKRPRFLMHEIPAGIIYGTSELEIRGDLYIIMKSDSKDKNGLQVLWLKGK